MLEADASTSTEVSVDFDDSIAEDDRIVELSSPTLGGDQLDLGLDDVNRPRFPGA
ncbi:hypothetical protein ACFQXB_18665 [Plastorhodobacter daqingensis]|uniref:Uncharacterized protein n=1 Tax=Plastorhodobacter daqingensis TaxID=1387281 RepID=A0ABW2UN27_9RHOB